MKLSGLLKMVQEDLEIAGDKEVLRASYTYEGVTNEYHRLSLKDRSKRMTLKEFKGIMREKARKAEEKKKGQKEV